MITPYDNHCIVHIRNVDHPESLSVGAQCVAYTTGTGCQVYRVDLQSNTATVFARTPNRCLGQAVDAAGNLYGADCVAGVVLRIAPQGRIETYAAGPGGIPFRCANYPAFDPQGNLYLSDSGDWSGERNGYLYKIPPGGGEAALWYPEAVDTPNAIALDAAGRALRIAEAGYDAKDVALWPKGAFTGRIRWSTDNGRTWSGETAPPAWKVGARGVSEGSLVRAANGWIAAALRTDMPARYLDQPHDDSLEGLGISLSKDDGRTWSPIEVLFDAGRHHPHLLLLPSGEIAMTYIVRDDVRGGELASYLRGCEALISRDHGQSWDLDRRIALDEFAFFDGVKWFNGETGHLYSTLLDDGSILTCYGKYLAKGAALIRWHPET